MERNLTISIVFACLPLTRISTIYHPLECFDLDHQVLFPIVNFGVGSSKGPDTRLFVRQRNSSSPFFVSPASCHLLNVLSPFLRQIIFSPPMSSGRQQQQTQPPSPATTTATSEPPLPRTPSLPMNGQLDISTSLSFTRHLSK